MQTLSDELCRTSVAMMLIGMAHYKKICRACADICKECVEELRAGWRHGRVRESLPCVGRELPKNDCLKVGSRNR